MAIDFVKEGDAWKIWHIVEANDIVSEAGTAYGDGPVYLDYETDPVAVEFGTPRHPHDHPRRHLQLVGQLSRSPHPL